MIHLRYVTDQDYDTIHDALKRSFKLAKRKKKLVSKYDYCDGPRMVDAIVKDKLVESVIVNETYLICYTVNDVWYSDDKILSECLVMRLHKTEHTFECVVEALEILAKVNGCVGICAGTAFSSNDNELASKYKSLGFENSGFELYKGV